MHVIGVAGDVRSRLLAGRRVVVDPALPERAIERLHVVVAKDGGRALHFVLRLLDGVLERHAGDQRRVEVVVVQFGDAEDPLAQREVPVEGRQVGVHAIHQRGLNRRRQVGAVQGPLHRGLVVAGAGLKQGGLHGSGQRAANRAAIAAQGPEEGCHRLAPVVAVRRGTGR